MQNKKQIVFIESYSTVMTYKIAKMFKQKGYRTILIRLLEPKDSDEAFYADAYTKVINFNMNFSTRINLKKTLLNPISLFKQIKHISLTFIQISKLDPYIIFGKANPNLPIAFFRIWFRKYPFVYFPYDMHVHWCPSMKFAKIRGISKFEIKAERFCFEHADGIMHKGAPNELEYLNGRILGNNIQLPKHQIAFHPYCSKEFCVFINKNKLSKKDREIHMVYIGGGGEIKKSDYSYFFGLAKPIISQKIHFHLYLSQLINSKKDETKEFLEECKNEKNYKYFHIHRALNPKEIINEISKYDFGVSPPGSFKCSDLETKFCTGNKISTYLEAGLPFFYKSELLFIDKLMKGYGLNLNWPNNMNRLKKITKKLNYKELERSILKAREDFNMDKNFLRLEEFIKKVVASKKDRG